MEIGRRLRAALAGWLSGDSSARELRMQLLRLLAMLETIEP
jgi:hypothetical protein